MESLLKLGFIVNPYIKGEVERLLSKTDDKIIIDSATLFESRLNEFCQYTMYVSASFGVRRDRIVKRDKISEEIATQRIKAQKEEIFFNKKYDFILNGNFKKEKILNEVSEMVAKIENM